MNFNNLWVYPKITKICGKSLSIIPWIHTKFGGIWITFELNHIMPLINNLVIIPK